MTENHSQSVGDWLRGRPVSEPGQVPPGQHRAAPRPAAPPQAGQHPSIPLSPAEQAAYARGQQDAARKLTTPTMSGYRVACGICWSFWTLLFIIGVFAAPGFGSKMLSLVLAGWYAYRIWTLKARRLTFFLIF
jgi:hypothetical protein